MASTNIPKHNHYLLLKIKLFFIALKERKVTLRKIVTVAWCTMAYWFQWEKSAPSPFVLSLELWNECNAGCLFCRDAKGRIYNLNPEKPSINTISKGKMPVEMAEDIIKKLKNDVLIAVLYTNGEPLLYKDLPRVIQCANDNHVLSMISTNGLLFTEQNARAILTSGIDFIKIQLGGFTQDIYSIQIRYGNVETLKENIRMLARIKKEVNSHALILIDWITYNYNRHQIPLIRQFCKELDLMLSFRAGNPRGGLEDKENPLPNQTLNMSCDWLWKGMQVNFNGDVLQCCEAVVWAGASTYTTYKVGTSSPQSIFNSPAALSMRRKMTQNGRASISMCKNCQRTGVAFKW